MTSPPIHPLERLSQRDKCKIYYYKVVRLAVAQGLLAPDPDTETGHFAFSAYYRDGEEMDRILMARIERYYRDHPAAAALRRRELDLRLKGAASSFEAMSSEEKIRELVTIGASRLVWPTGTSYVLTYPWRADGTPHVVEFRKDLTDFMKRRVIRILEKAGKLRSPDPFAGH
jgi:hypothetical protein